MNVSQLSIPSITKHTSVPILKCPPKNPWKTRQLHVHKLRIIFFLFFLSLSLPCSGSSQSQLGGSIHPIHQTESTNHNSYLIHSVSGFSSRRRPIRADSDSWSTVDSFTGQPPAEWLVPVDSLSPRSSGHSPTLTESSVLVPRNFESLRIRLPGRGKREE